MKVKVLLKAVTGGRPERIWYSRIERIKAVSLVVKGVERGK